jgi:hypothetical protein
MGKGWVRWASGFGCTGEKEWQKDRLDLDFDNSGW